MTTPNERGRPALPVGMLCLLLTHGTDTRHSLLLSAH